MVFWGLVLGLCQQVVGQVENLQETKFAYKIDTTADHKWAPTGIRVGMDIAGPIYNLWEPRIFNYEAMADIDFSKFFGVAEIGTGGYQAQSSDLTNYQSSGVFMRIGADVNMIARDPHLNVFFFGLRYATSTYRESVQGATPANGWPADVKSLEQSGSRANWAEMNIGMRVRLKGPFFAGYAIRLKLLKHNTYNEGRFDSFFIPGYGVAANTTNWGVSYYIQYRVAWKKKPIFWRE